MSRRRHKPTRLLVANLDKDRPGDRRYRRRLRKIIRRNGGRGVLGVVEEGRGVTSTRLAGIRTWIRPLSRIRVGDVGAHNGVARAWVRVDHEWAMVFAAHGLHRKTNGLAAHDTYYDLLAEHTRRLDFDGKPWAVLADFNNDPHEIAKVLGGTAYRAPGDVMGIVVSPGLAIVGAGWGSIGKRKGWTGHVEAWVDVALTKEKP